MSHCFHQSDLWLLSVDRCLTQYIFSTHRGEASPGLREAEQYDEEEGAEESHRTMIDRLLESHGACIPNHEPKMYRTAAAKTKSIPGFSILAFPDFWGHLPPPGPEPMAPRKPNIQRYSTLISTYLTAV